MKVPHALYSLAASLRATSSSGAALTAEVNAGRVVFRGGRYGEASLDASCSTVERVKAHWAGYVAANGAASATEGA
jgi:hypothetical protein